MTAPGPPGDRIVCMTVTAATGRQPVRGPLRVGKMYRVVIESYPDNRWMAEARRIHVEYHRRRR